MRPFLTIVASAPGMDRMDSSEEISAISCAIPPDTTHEFRRRTSPDLEIASGEIQPSSLGPGLLSKSLCVPSAI